VTAVTVPRAQTQAVARNRTSPRAVIQLGLREARRILTHPTWLAFLTYVVAEGGIRAATDMHQLIGDRKTRGDTIAMVFVFALPVICLFPSNLVASSARRSGAVAMIEATPLSRTLRTAATCVGVAIVSVVSIAAALLIWHESQPIGLDPSSLDGLEWAQIVSIPLLYLGSGLLGVAVARWLPWPGVAFITVVALVSWTGFGGSPTSRAQASIPWVHGGQQGWIGSEFYDISHAWHAAYLLGLCGLAATAAILRDHPRRMVLIGAGFALFTVAAGLAQLP